MLSTKFFYSLLKAHEEIHNYASDTLSHFNFFLERRLPRMIREHCAVNVTVPASSLGFSETKRHVVTFEKITLERPTVPNTDGVARGIRVMQIDGEPLFPSEALIRGLTYSAGVFVDLVHDVYSGEGDDETLEESIRYKNIYFFNMPIAVGCVACVTQDPELARDSKAHYDPEDKGGYWIVRGMVKVIQPQKVQRNNILLVRNIVKGAERWLEANIRSIRADDKFRSTSTLKAYLLSNGMLTIDIPYLKTNQTVVSAFRLLGWHDRKDIEDFVFDEGSLPFGARVDQMEAARRLFATSFAPALASCSEDELITTMGATLTSDGDFGKLKRMVHQQICGELLPHCGFDDSLETRTKKAMFLGMMCRRMLFIQLGFEDEDDRDFEGFKQLQMCSTTLSMLMRQLMGQFSKTLRKRIFDRVKAGNTVDVASIIHHMDCLPQVSSSAASSTLPTAAQQALHCSQQRSKLFCRVDLVGSTAGPITCLWSHAVHPLSPVARGFARKAAHGSFAAHGDGQHHKHPHALHPLIFLFRAACIGIYRRRSDGAKGSKQCRQGSHSACAASESPESAEPHCEDQHPVAQERQVSSVPQH